MPIRLRSCISGVLPNRTIRTILEGFALEKMGVLVGEMRYHGAERWRLEPEAGRRICLQLWSNYVGVRIRWPVCRRRRRRRQMWTMLLSIEITCDRRMLVRTDCSGGKSRA